jgi:hypothetical protein
MAKTKRYVDPGAPLDDNNLPLIKGKLDFNLPKQQDQNYVGDTGTSTYVGEDYQPSIQDNTNTYASDIPNLDNIRASNQGIFNSLGNSFAKFVGKTGLNIVGGIAGTVYGAGAAMAEGKISNLWNNSLMDTLDQADKGLDNIFKVYKSSDYQDKNFLQRMFLHPLQFTDDTTSALSFTAGAILTELGTAGLGSEFAVGKALKYLKGFDQGAEALEATQQLGSFGQKIVKGLGDASTITRQLATGAGYESMVEARQASMELRNNMVTDWQKQNPNQQMPDDVKADIDQRASNSGLATYLSNLALVGHTNLVEFPKIFGLGNKTMKAAEGGIFKNIKDKYESYLKKTTFGKIQAILKNPFEEGIKEEGLQDVIQATNKKYFDRSNKNQDLNTYLTNFAQATADTYTSKEGWNDIGMGMIIGSLGAPGRGALSIFGKNNNIGKYGFEEIKNDKGETIDYKRREVWDGGISGALKEYGDKIEDAGKMADDLNKTDAFTALRANYDFISKVKTNDNVLDNSLDINDVFNFHNAKDNKIHEYVASRIKSGLQEDLNDDINKMSEMSTDDFFTAFKGTETAQSTSDKDKNKFKEETILQFQDKIKNTKKAYDIVNSRTELEDNEDLKDELTNYVASSYNLDSRERLINNDLLEQSGGSITNLNSLNTTSVKENIEKYTEDLKTASGESKINLENALKQLNKVSTKDLTGDEFNMLVNMAQKDPNNFNAKHDDIIKKLDDSRKLRNLRQGYIGLYNYLFTKEGQKYRQDSIDNLQKEEDNAKIQKDKDKVEKEVLDNQQKTKDKVEAAKIKKNDVAEEIIPENIQEIPLPTIENVPIENNVELNSVKNSDQNIITSEEETVAKIVNSNEIIENNIKEIKQDGLVKNSTKVESIKNNLKFSDKTFKRTVANTIISLNIDYVELVLGNISNKINEKDIYDQYDDNGNVKINENFDSRLQDPKQFNEGTEVKIIFPTYEQIKEKGIEGNYTIGDYTTSLDNLEEFPIAFVDNNDKIIGFLPTTTNVRNRVSSQNLDVAIIANQKLRQQLNDNKDNNITIKITSKSTGAPIFNKNSKSIYKALGDGKSLSEGVEIAVVKDNKIMIALDQQSNKLIANNDLPLEEGVVYSITPTGDGVSSHIIPMDVENINENQAKTILKLIQLSKANTNELIEERNNISNEIDLEKGFDGLNKALQNIIYTDNKLGLHHLSFNKDNLIFGLSQKFSWNDVMNNELVQKQIVELLMTRYNAVKLSNFGKPFQHIMVDSNNKIQFMQHNNYLDYLNHSNVIKTNLQGQKISNSDNLYFTAQSVIEISNPIIKNNNKPTNVSYVEESPQNQIEQNLESPVVKEKVIKPKNSMRSQYVPGKSKNISQIEEDSNILNNKSIEEQAEDLENECGK